VPVSNMRKWYSFVGSKEFVVLFYMQMKMEKKETLRDERREPKQTTKYKSRNDQKVNANKIQLQIQI
jgi:hypothetical protein